MARRVKGQVDGKIRKTQAVAKTRSQKIIAIINSNAVHSPLLSLPAEIRENILKSALGGRLIHVRRCVKDPSTSSLMGSDEHQYTVKDLCHIICHAPADIRHRPFAVGDHPEYEIPRGKGGLLTCCVNTVAWPKSRTAERAKRVLDLSILRASRQLYEEAGHILFTTNTFSFCEPHDFTIFARSLNPAQRRKIRSLEFGVTFGERFSNRYFEEPKAWELHACKSPIVVALSGLKKLYLHLTQHSDTPLMPSMFRFLPRSEVEKVDIVRGGFSQFRGMKALDIKTLCITISDDQFDVLGYLSQRLTDHQKNTLIDEFRIELLDSIKPAASLHERKSHQMRLRGEGNDEQEKILEG